MLTDEDLTRQLHDAFHDEGGSLRYAGPVPRPRGRLVSAGSAVGALAAAAVLVTVWSGTSADPDRGAPTARPDLSTPTTHADSAVRSARIHLAGFTFAYTTGADGAADDLRAVMHPGSVPDGATPIPAPEGVNAWVGTDPASGDHGLYVQAPTRNGGELFGLLSPTWTFDQLEELFTNGSSQ